MESTLNFQNRGESFDAELCYKWLAVLKRTGALSSEYILRRRKSLSKLQRKISKELSSTSCTTDSSVGVVLEESRQVKDMDSACTDDVAAARLIVDSLRDKLLVLHPVCFGTTVATMVRSLY